MYLSMKDSRTEQQFLADYDASQFDRPSVATDVVVMTVVDGVLKALVIERTEHPHRGRWMLPGGFVAIDEGLHDAASRLLQAKTGVADVFLEQLYTFGSPNRDPRTRVITVAYLALVPFEKLRPASGALADIVVDWPGEEGGPGHAVLDGSRLPLAFDHADILGTAVQRLRGRLNYTPIGYALLPEHFTLRRLQEVHEAILGHRVNKPSFRRKVLGQGEIVPTGTRESGVDHRPAELYRLAFNP